MYHRPVLLEESLDGMNIRKGGTYIDFTFGGGGHSKGILDRIGEGRLIAFDQDPDAAGNLLNDNRLLFIRGNFRYVRNFLRFNNLTSIDGALADLGVSSHHFDAAERGFSFRHDSGIDMRMNPGSGKSASGILNRYEEKELAHLFRKYGEVRNATRLASVICSARKRKKIETTGEFLEAISDCIPEKTRQKYLARVFQALRIEVNAELDSLVEMLQGVSPFMPAGARFAIITYHSLEDRIVKNFFRTGNAEGKVEKDFYGNLRSSFKPVNRNVIQPGENEIKENPRARSAKLRIAEKTMEG
jgi:16S rRNA (cytosine1402-N4)-methyltransferase